MASASADRSEPTRRRTFLVGRVSPSTTVVHTVGEYPTPLQGPWDVKAIVRPTGARLRLVR